MALILDSVLRRPVLATAGVLVAATASAPGAAAQGAPPAAVAGARLQGDFLLSGRVTVAERIRGEHVGELITRRWRFLPLCASGQCPTIVLVRRRHAGTDTVTLVRRSPGHYAGKGSFAAPLKCDGTTYPNGVRVPFKITVRIDQASLSSDIAIATRVSATYTNAIRINQSPCFSPGLGHDAATYHGHVVVPT